MLALAPVLALVLMLMLMLVLVLVSCTSTSTSSSPVRATYWLLELLASLPVLDPHDSEDSREFLGASHEDPRGFVG